ncbi:ABC transporter permease [Alicyclobacillus shizuokensis]|uniref:ABC transporter permease n=1 Tax=Alicyclobacillus shizuokensis TaxID=392014 RepID=UPI0008301713|nr:ABC transporter permease [Alicyclobacillus shizuokensis]
MAKQKLELTVRLLVVVVVVAYLLWAYVLGSFSYMVENSSQMVFMCVRHLQLAGISSLLAVIISVPAGIAVTRKSMRRFSFVVENIANLGQTIPGLAVMALAMTYMGVGMETAIFAIWVYSLLPILRNTIAGLESVNTAILDAGKGMGMTATQIFFKLELPNAARTILGGVRTSIVINVGTAALASLIGGGGLGDLIFMGISLDDTGTMLAGAIPVTFLAFFIDFLLGRLEKIIVPKGLRAQN